MNILTYKNVSLATKTFYGVTFEPGQIKDVPGYINDPKFILMDMSDIKNPDTITESDAGIKAMLKTPKAEKPTAEKTNRKQGGKSDGTDSNK